MTTERKWRFGVVKVDLKAADYGLDEDGWVEMRARLTARDLEAMVGGDSQFAFLPGMMLGWSLKVDGEDIGFDRSEALDILPLDILNTVVEELQKQPFFEKYIQAASTDVN